MSPRLLLDTHILVRWLIQSRSVSRKQHMALETATKTGEPLAFSAITLVEISMLFSRGKLALNRGLEDFFELVQASPLLRLYPLTYEIAVDIESLSLLKEPADQIIVATARVHRLRLVTSDQRIIESKLVPVIE